MVEFETLEEKEVALARGCLRVASAKAISDNGSETEFLSIRKIGENGKFKQLLTIPKSAEVVDALTDALKGLADQASSYLCRNKKGVIGMGGVRHSDEFMMSRGWRKKYIEMFQTVEEARKFVKFNMLLEKRSRHLFEVGFTIKKLWGKYFVTIWRRR